jgi:hypothetical protein
MLNLDTFIKTKSNGPNRIWVIMGNVEIKSFIRNQRGEIAAKNLVEKMKKSIIDFLETQNQE